MIPVETMHGVNIHDPQSIFVEKSTILPLQKHGLAFKIFMSNVKINPLHNNFLMKHLLFFRSDF